MNIENMSVKMALVLFLALSVEDGISVTSSILLDLSFLHIFPHRRFLLLHEFPWFSLVAKDEEGVDELVFI